MDIGIGNYIFCLNLFLAILLFVSEMLAFMKCEYHGVLHFMIYNCLPRRKVSVDINIEEQPLVDVPPRNTDLFEDETTC
jgi:hypothetical protein